MCWQVSWNTSIAEKSVIVLRKDLECSVAFCGRLIGAGIQSSGLVDPQNTFARNQCDCLTVMQRLGITLFCLDVLTVFGKEAQWSVVYLWLHVQHSEIFQLVQLVFIACMMFFELKDATEQHPKRASDVIPVLSKTFFAFVFSLE